MERNPSPGSHLTMRSDLSLRERWTDDAVLVWTNLNMRQFLMSMALRMPSLSRLKQIDTAKIMTPGNAATHGLT